MTIYKDRRRSKVWVWIAALVTFVGTLTLLWTDAGGLG